METSISAPQGGRIPAPSGRLQSIDFLRGLAALSVLCHHAINFGWGQNMPMQVRWFRWIHAVVDRGSLGVPLFFVISGYCIHLQWARGRAAGQSGEIDYARFWRRRLLRLYPPYFVMLCVSMGLVALAAWTGHATPLVTRYPEPRAAWMTWDFLAHALMLHGLIPLFDQGGGNPPFWTLAREEYLYALYFLLLAWRRTRGPAFAVALSLGVGLIPVAALAPWLERVPGGADWIPLVRTSALALWVQWSLGMWAAEADLGLAKIPGVFRRIWAAPLWAAAALVAQARLPLLEPALWGLAFFTLLNACVAREREGRWPRIALARWLTGAGLFSYSIYLVHVPARAVLKQALGHLAGTPNPVLYMLLAALFAVTGYFAGKLFFLLVERRFLRAGKSTAEPRASSELQ